MQVIKMLREMSIGVVNVHIKQLTSLIRSNSTIYVVYVIQVMQIPLSIKIAHQHETWRPPCLEVRDVYTSTKVHQSVCPLTLANGQSL